VESLHDVIQNSLTGDTKEFDLQTEQRDLLQQIRDGIEGFATVEGGGFSEGLAENGNLDSNVQTDSSDQAAKANGESLKYQQASSETLSEMLTFFKRQANSGGLVIS